MTNYIFMAVKPNKTNRYAKPLILLGIAYAVWSELSRRRQEEKIHRLAIKLDELVQGEGE